MAFRAASRRVLVGYDPDTSRSRRSPTTTRRRRSRSSRSAPRAPEGAYLALGFEDPAAPAGRRRSISRSSSPRDTQGRRTSRAAAARPRSARRRSRGSTTTAARGARSTLLTDETLAFTRSGHVAAQAAGRRAFRRREGQLLSRLGSADALLDARAGRRSSQYEKPPQPARRPHQHRRGRAGRDDPRRGRSAAATAAAISASGSANRPVLAGLAQARHPGERRGPEPWTEVPDLFGSGRATTTTC